MTDGGGGAETPNIAALPALARLGACETARGPALIGALNHCPIRAGAGVVGRLFTPSDIDAGGSSTRLQLPYLTPIVIDRMA